MKTCPRCERTLPRSDYYVDPSRHDGVTGYCRECMRSYNREREARLRAAVVALLGGECAECGILDPRLLAVDHVKGSGARWRRAGLTQTTLYGYVLRHPDAFQLLCHNCNWLKRLDHDLDAPPVAVPNLAPQPRPCEVCGTVFTPRRQKAARFCGAARCYQRAYRARQREEA